MEIFEYIQYFVNSSGQDLGNCWVLFFVNSSGQDLGFQNENYTSELSFVKKILWHT